MLYETRATAAIWTVYRVAGVKDDGRRTRRPAARKTETTAAATVRKGYCVRERGLGRERRFYPDGRCVYGRRVRPLGGAARSADSDSDPAAAGAALRV